MTQDNIEDRILKSRDEIDPKVPFEDWDYKSYFSHVCDLMPDLVGEKLEPKNIRGNKYNESGVVYVFVVSGWIVYIEHTTRKRIGNYNGGNTKGSGGTNKRILESMLYINKTVNVYMFTEKPCYCVLGESHQDGRAPARTAEKVVLKKFRNLPTLNKQN